MAGAPTKGCHGGNIIDKVGKTVESVSVARIEAALTRAEQHTAQERIYAELAEMAEQVKGLHEMVRDLCGLAVQYHAPVSLSPVPATS